MKIAVISNIASFHHVAKLLSKESEVWHYGANSLVPKSKNYHPVPGDFHLKIPVDIVGTGVIDPVLSNVIKDIKNKNIDFVLTSGTELSWNKAIQDSLTQLNIPYFFVNIKSAYLEYNKFKAKQVLSELGIPTAPSIFEEVNGQFLFDKFYDIARPFVIKIYRYQYGKQTTIVTNDNFQEVYLDLFSKKLGLETRSTNINNDWLLILEEVINIKKELSCHYLINEKDCRYLGSARDYKQFLNGDTGHNSRSLGAYNVNEIDKRIHEYADKIFNYLKIQNYHYKGFLFLGIAVDETDTPVVLEINTRAGDPEINVVLESIDNNLGDLLFAASTNSNIPNIVHNNKKTVSVRLINSVYNWEVPASRLPKLLDVPDNIIHSLEGRNQFYITHSLFTASSNTHKNASKKIYTYLDKQDVGQYRYRSDIGILK